MNKFNDSARVKTETVHVLGGISKLLGSEAQDVGTGSTGKCVRPSNCRGANRGFWEEGKYSAPKVSYAAESQEKKLLWSHVFSIPLNCFPGNKTQDFSGVYSLGGRAKPTQVKH